LDILLFWLIVQDTWERIEKLLEASPRWHGGT